MLSLKEKTFDDLPAFNEFVYWLNRVERKDIEITGINGRKRFDNNESTR